MIFWTFEVITNSSKIGNLESDKNTDTNEVQTGSDQYDLQYEYSKFFENSLGFLHFEQQT